MIHQLESLKEQKVNILIIGGTGVGKSSTINALFGKNISKVGDNPSPETMEITNYKLDNNITLWDSPGLGDGIKDIGHKEKITSLLKEQDVNGNMLIDCILVILSANSKDLGTEYELINNIIIPNVSSEPEKHVIVSINKADEALSNRYWLKEKNEPSNEQKEFLEEKTQDIRKRIYESTGINIKKPIYYSAGYNDENFSEPSYNIDNLMIYILKSIPKEKVVNTMEEFENITKDVLKAGLELVAEVVTVAKDVFKGILKGIFSLFK